MLLLRRIFRIFSVPALVLFISAFLVFLVGSNVRIAFGNSTLYELGFTRHDVSQTTGLSTNQLSYAGQEIRDYFNSADEYLEVSFTVSGANFNLFDQREIIHMKDVKELLNTVSHVQEGSFLFLFIFVTMGLFIDGTEFANSLRRLIIRASLFSVALITLLGIVAAIAFGPLFTLFHELSFSNDFWILNPETSYLVRMFPQAFWLEGTLLIGALTIAEALGIIALLALARWWNHRQELISRRKEPQFTVTVGDILQE